MAQIVYTEAGTPRRLGWNKQLNDGRDLLYGEVFPEEAAAPLPPSASNAKWRPRIEDQKNLGSCVGHARTSLEEAHAAKAGLPTVQLSRLFVYYGARDVEGTTQSDSGCYIRDAFKFTNAFGICNESLWTYSDDGRKFKKKPTKEAYRNALLRSKRPFYFLAGLQEIKANTAAGWNTEIGIVIYEGFMTNAVARTGRVPIPNKKIERMLGGHAVMVDGYDDALGCLICVNSWGENWGRQGEFLLPYEFIMDSDLSADFGTARL